MPLYHTMGIHSLLAASVVGGCFVPQPSWDPEQALELIEHERIDSLYLAPRSSTTSSTTRVSATSTPRRCAPSHTRARR